MSKKKALVIEVGDLLTTPVPTGRSRWLSVLSVTAEIMVTAGVGVLLYVFWFAVVNPAVVGAGQTATAAQQSRLYSEHLPQSEATPSASPQASATPAPDDSPVAPVAPVVVPVMAEPARSASPIAVIYIPRFGADWKRVVRQSTSDQVLNSATAGVGHYTGTAMPGGIGNFAIAAHDTGYGNTFLGVSTLKLGDRIYLQTDSGWYTYEFRNFQYVQPNAINVLNAVPTVSTTATTDRIITMTTCNPPYHAAERMIAYGTFLAFSTAAPGELGPTLARGN
ncbi:MAG: sortase [Microbacteriaceae bacterium]|nr:sortase [Microbacteriaceae bacterium]